MASHSCLHSASVIWMRVLATSSKQLYSLPSGQLLPPRQNPVVVEYEFCSEADPDEAQRSCSPRFPRKPPLSVCVLLPPSQVLPEGRVAENGPPWAPTATYTDDQLLGYDPVKDCPSELIVTVFAVQSAVTVISRAPFAGRSPQFTRFCPWIPLPSTRRPLCRLSRWL